MNNIRILQVILPLMLMLFVPAAHAQTQAGFRAQELRIPDDLVVYKIEYDRISASTTPQSLGKLFALGAKASWAFLEMNNDATLEAAVYGDATTPEGYAKARKTFEDKIALLAPGYYVGKGAEIFYYFLKSDEALAFAKKHGNAEDIAFFEIYHTVYPNSEYWPIYHPQVTDFQGCSDMGALAKTYTLWKNFHATAKDPVYKAFAADQLPEKDPKPEEIGFKDLCSCNSQKETIAGLQKLAKIVYNIEKKEIEDTIKLIESGKAASKNIRFDAKCNF